MYFFHALLLKCKWKKTLNISHLVWNLDLLLFKQRSSDSHQTVKKDGGWFVSSLVSIGKGLWRFLCWSQILEKTEWGIWRQVHIKNGWNVQKNSEKASWKFGLIWINVWFLYLFIYFFGGLEVRWSTFHVFVTTPFIHQPTIFKIQSKAKGMEVCGKFGENPISGFCVAHFAILQRHIVADADEN